MSVSGGWRISQSLARLCEPLILAVAGRVGGLRELAPYPSWRFDQEWNNRGALFRLRRVVWQALQQSATPPGLTVPWHAGTRLSLDMRNEIARQIFVGATIDPNEFCFLSRIVKPGMWIADAGANEGIYTIFFAALAGPGGRVLAIEPSSRERARLAANIELNRLGNIEVLPWALTDRDGTEPLHVADTVHSGHNTLGAFVHDTSLAAVEPVQATPLDALSANAGWPRLDILKADVEGAELRLLAGAEQTLRRHYPLLMLEASGPSLKRQGASVEDLLAFLGHLGYEVFVFAEKTGLAEPLTGLPSPDNYNIVAIPNAETRRGRTLHYNLDWAS